MISALALASVATVGNAAPAADGLDHSRRVLTVILSGLAVIELG